MTWQPLSRRSSGSKPDGPYEGVPGHMLHGVLHWVNSVVGYEFSSSLNRAGVRIIATRLRVHVSPAADEFAIMEKLNERARTDPEFCLDLVDCILDLFGMDSNNWEELAILLHEAGSVYRVDGDGTGLTRRVSDEMQTAFAQATSESDEASNELRNAWSNAFGRNGDPSDAWDHAIKAVEDVLIPVVAPKNAKATLSNVLGELNGPQSEQWQLVLPGNDKLHAVTPLVSMLRLMWPNHDRHGGSTPKRTPSEIEAQAVVTLATTIVQWHRLGWVIQKR